MEKENSFVRGLDVYEGRCNVRPETFKSQSLSPPWWNIFQEVVAAPPITGIRFYSRWFLRCVFCRRGSRCKGWGGRQRDEGGFMVVLALRGEEWERFILERERRDTKRFHSLWHLAWLLPRWRCTGEIVEAEWDGKIETTTEATTNPPHCRLSKRELHHNCTRHETMRD